MQEHFEFNPSYAMLTLAMSPGEQIKSEPGAMVSMQGCEMATGSSGGFLKGLKKMAFGGESFFLNTFTAGPAGGWVSLAPSRTWRHSGLRRLTRKGIVHPRWILLGLHHER